MTRIGCRGATLHHRAAASRATIYLCGRPVEGEEAPEKWHCCVEENRKSSLGGGQRFQNRSFKRAAAVGGYRLLLGHTWALSWNALLVSTSFVLLSDLHILLAYLSITVFFVDLHASTDQAPVSMSCS